MKRKNFSFIWVEKQIFLLQSFLNFEDYNGGVSGAGKKTKQTGDYIYAVFDNILTNIQ